MQIKIIEKVISAKLNEWIDSIDDVILQKQLREDDNILLSGGSITSLLLGTDVNDFDIYIKNMDILLYLTIYYTKNFPEITILDGREKNSYIENLCNNYHSDIDEIQNAYSISVRNLHEDQIKLYFKGAKPGLKVDSDLQNNDIKYTPLFFSSNAISLSDGVQIVIRFHGDNEQIHKTFDFVHATNYFTFKSGLVTNVKALESILTKQLFYQGSLYPLTSIIRMKKFIKRQWNINAGEILKIMFQISELDLKNPDVLEEQLIGVDIAYFGKLIEILRGVDKDKLDSNYLNTIIDRVFNSNEEIDE